ncbi:2-dehydro-3-deoxygalactonokinase [Sedimentitalea todarodis]|uniref:2-dehydro-3-deoxygalactonokinase n=1 Tax=Sedimentitalea todarodis TaxID=1631240 RepID=A0ABU3VGH3_9RHOB|nr:2-dehydro-3-deoxygalactonokinase [Sedimentitalea todarodis]MDU9005188.1 2-dehydro-3-deoxygalactonokinase [Sedimentitalea todarodis]
MSKTAEWIAVDWGTSNLRAWVFGPDNTLIARLGSDHGMASLTPDAFEGILLDLIGPHLGDATTPAVCCGMVGARQGWQEAAYVTVPCTPPGAREATYVFANDPRIAPLILPGLQQTTPADVMRGEETQIAGYLAEHAVFDGVLCLPGTHTKWVQISAGEIVSFRTFMTGELFALLTGSSVLRHSVQTEGWDDAGFADAVRDALGSPQNFASRLFGVRAETLINDMPADVARSRLSGLLIGLELAGARAYWLGQQIAVVGDPILSRLYKVALYQQGVPVALADGDAMTLAGLKTAYKSLKET